MEGMIKVYKKDQFEVWFSPQQCGNHLNSGKKIRKAYNAYLSLEPLKSSASSELLRIERRNKHAKLLNTLLAALKAEGKPINLIINDYAHANVNPKQSNKMTNDEILDRYFEYLPKDKNEKKLFAKVRNLEDYLAETEPLKDEHILNILNEFSK